MSKGHGKDSYLSVEDSGAAVLRDLTTYLDNIDFDRNVDMSETTTMGAESKTFIPGLDGAGLEMSGKYDDTAVSGPDVVLGGNVGAKVLVGFEYGPLGNAAGKVKYSGECYVERYRISSPLEGVVKFTSTLRISGAVTKGVFA